MTDSSKQSVNRRAKGLDVISTLTGGEDPKARAEAFVNELGPIGSYVVDHVLGTVWARPELSRRDRSLIVISMLISIAQLRQLATHVKAGLNHGLTVEEVREVAVHLCGYVGFPRAIEAMRTINESIEEEMGEGAPAMVPADVIDDEKRHADGIGIFRHLTETPDGPDIDTRIRELEDVLGPMAEVAFDWGFGELWTRPQLSQRDRSLLIVAMLAVTGRDSQLQFHVPGALNNGVSVSELKEVMLMVSIYGGFPPAASAMRIVHEMT